MKQLSLFLIFIICLNTIDLISSNRYREYEAPRIVHTSTPQEQQVRRNSDDLEILNQEDTSFSSEKILKWIEEVEKKDIGKMKKEEIHHSLEGIKRASAQIQSYLKRISAQIEASINTIDLKVNEISIVDQKISQLKPEYKKELEKISKESGSLLTALKKEKTAVEKVLKKLRKESNSSSRLMSKSDDVEKKIDLLDLSKNVKERINEKLVSFMSLKNFEKAHKNFMTIVESEMEKNFEGYKQYSDDKIAADLIVKNWSDMLKQVEKEEEVVVESINKPARESLKDLEKEYSEEKDILDSMEDTEEEEDNKEEDIENHKENLSKKANRKIQEEKKAIKESKEDNEKENEKEENEDDENEDDEEGDDQEEEENLKDSEAEFDQEYFNKEKNDKPASFLEKTSSKKTYDDNEDDE